MKKIYICRVCEKEFKANAKTNIKTCSLCRGNCDSLGRFKIRQKKIIFNLNYALKTVKYNNTNGEYRLITLKNPLLMGNSISRLTNKRLLINYIRKQIRALELDLVNVNNIKNVFVNKNEK